MVLFCAHAVPEGARADEPAGRRSATEARPREALEFYERGRALYQQGRYAEAAEELERAIVLDPASPTLTYNVARVRELMNDYEAAIRYYDRFVQLLGSRNTEDRRRAEAAVERLSAALELQRQNEATARLEAEERERVAREARERELRETEERARLEAESRVHTRRGVSDAAFWVTLSSGLAVLGGGGTFAYLAWDSGRDAQGFIVGTGGTIDGRNRLVDTAKTYALTADILFGVGGALVVTSLLLFALRTEEVLDPGPVIVDAEASANGFVLRVGSHF